MTNQLTTQTYSPAAGMSCNIRVATLDGEPWFVAADVCRAVGLPMDKGTYMHVSKLRPDEKRTVTAGEFAHGADLGTPQGGLNAHTKLTIISESGFYRMMFRGDKPEARAFTHWACTHVLPTIRKTGSYIMGEERLNDPNLSPEDRDAINARVQAFAERKAAMLAERVAGLRRANGDAMTTQELLERARVLAREVLDGAEAARSWRATLPF